MQNDDLDELQDQEKTRLKNKLPQRIKPCIAKMLGSCLAKGNTFARSEVALIIAVEMHRLGKDKEKTLSLLMRWNKDNRPPIRPPDVRSAVNRAYRNEKYDYGCNNAVVLNFCRYRDKAECPFYSKLMVKLGRKGKGRHSELDFYKKGWPKVLKSSEAMLYLALRPIEKLQGKRAGQMVVVPYRLLHRYSGVNMGLIAKHLEKLKKVGLIDYKKGEPYLWKIQATEITRIIPIPKPCKNAKS